MPTVSAPLAFRWAGIAWPLASERVRVSVERAPGPLSRVTSEDGWSLLVAADLPPPVPPSQDEGPLEPIAAVLRARPRPRGVALRSGAVGRPRPGLAPALRVATRRALRELGEELPGQPVEDLLEVAIARGAPYPQHPKDERLAWLSDHLLLFEDPSTPPPPADHGVGGVDPRLVLEAELDTLLPALTGHGVPDKPVWRVEHLDRALREAGLLSRWPVEGIHHLALVEPGRRASLHLALEIHGLRPAECRPGGPGVRTEP